MLTGFDSLFALALVNNDKVIKGNKRLEVCKNCGKAFITDDTREFCSYNCQKSA